MAAALHPESRSREDFVDEFLTCSICAEPYDGGSHQAKCLPCLHTYCKSCLEGVAGKRSKLDCPKCRKLIKLPGETVESLPNNFLVENLREYQNIFNLQVLCGNCDNGNSAVSFCHDCGVFLCQDCAEGHQKIRSIRHHQIVTMEELQAKKYNPMIQQQQHCKKHPKQELNMYCKNDGCNIPVCASCDLVDHRNHNLVHLEAAINEIMNTMRDSSEKVNNRCQKLDESNAKIKAVQRELSDNFAHKEKSLKEFEQELVGSIKAQFGQAHDHLKKLYEAEQDQLNRKTESLDRLTADMNSACEFTNQLHDMGHSTKLLSSQKQIMDRLKELETTALPETASETTDFVFTSIHQSAMTQIQDLLQNLGDISVRPQVDTQQCTIQLNLESEKEGLLRKAILQVVDSKGQKISIGGDEIKVTQDGMSLGVVEDSNDGSYTFHYNTSRCDSKPLHVEINGTDMKGSPFSTFCTVPKIDFEKCTFEFESEESAIVHVVDCNGKAVPNAEVEATQDEELILAENNGDGSYTIYLDTDSLLYVSIDETEMIGSPFNIYELLTL